VKVAQTEADSSNDCPLSSGPDSRRMPSNPSGPVSKSKNNGGKRASRQLSAGRPPTVSKPQASLSSQKTRQLINEHHQLNKQITKAELDGDRAAADELRKRIERLGGLKLYQLASLEGQSKERGGDSSVVLMQWLQPIIGSVKRSGTKLRLLEVGALSTKNACSNAGIFEIQRIDLHSQGEGILQQDFMERPIPNGDADQVDIISLSLVLNFVPSPVGRGDMLRRTCQFLDTCARAESEEQLRHTFPALFMVLPAPCITNSRYMSEERITCLMASLGYIMLHFKQTAKLVYYLWQLRDEPSPEDQDFAKKQVNPGPARNNFCVVLR